MAKSKKEEVKMTSTSYADLKGLNKFQRFAFLKQYPQSEEDTRTEEEWDEIAKKIDL